MRTSGSFLYKNGLYTVMCAQAIRIIQSNETIDIEKLITKGTNLIFVRKWSIKVSKLRFWSFEESDRKRWSDTDIAFQSSDLFPSK